MNYMQVQVIQESLNSVPGAIQRVLLGPGAMEVAQGQQRQAMEAQAQQQKQAQQGQLINQMGQIMNARAEAQAKRAEAMAKWEWEENRRRQDQDFHYDLAARGAVARQVGKKGGNPAAVAALFARDGQAPPPQPTGKVRPRGTGVRTPAPAPGGGAPPPRGSYTQQEISEHLDYLMAGHPPPPDANGVPTGGKNIPYKPNEVYNLRIEEARKAKTEEEFNRAMRQAGIALMTPAKMAKYISRKVEKPKFKPPRVPNTGQGPVVSNPNPYLWGVR